MSRWFQAFFNILHWLSSAQLVPVFNKLSTKGASHTHWSSVLNFRLRTEKFQIASRLPQSQTTQQNSAGVA